MGIVVALIALAVAGPLAMQPAPVTIVALGDSTTAGAPAFKSPIEAPPDGRGNVESQYAFWLMRERPHWRVLNRGVDGERTDEIAARFDRDVLAARPDVVVILGGVNDIYQGRSPDTVEQQLAQMYARAGRAGIRVVAATILPYNTATATENAAMAHVNRWIHRTAEGDPTIAFCDTRAAVASRDQPDRLASSPDGLHPSVAGHRRLAEALLPTIEAALRDRPGSPARSGR